MQTKKWIKSKNLTSWKPVIFGLSIFLQNVSTSVQFVRCLIQYTILKSLSHNMHNTILNQFVTTKLLLGFVAAHQIIFVAFIQTGYATQFLMIPRVLLLVGLDNGFWKQASNEQQTISKPSTWRSYLPNNIKSNCEVKVSNNNYVTMFQVMQNLLVDDQLSD